MSGVLVSARKGLDSAFDEVAHRIFKVCRAHDDGGPIAIGLCGGRSVVGLLGALRRESHHQPRELLGRIHFFMVDERLVPLEDEQSNYGGLKRLLFDSLVGEGMIVDGQLHPFVTQPTTSDFGCSAYRDELGKFGGRFSVVVVGVGEDGHIAGLFPNHRALSETEDMFLHFHDSPKPPADRMTASTPLITGADLAVVLALGEGKRAAWEAFRNELTPANECPAKLALAAKECVVLTDLE